MNLAEHLSEIATRYSFERARAFSNNRLAHQIRTELADEGKKLISFRTDDILVKGSAGAGNWASVPWLGFFDQLITKSAQTGFYVVFLINPQSHQIVLSLNQGATSIFREFGNRRGLEVLRRRARDMADRVSDLVGDLSHDPIDLGSDETLPSGYCAGHALGRVYTSDEIEQSMVTADLDNILDIYQSLIDRGGLTPSDSMLDEAGTTSLEEARRYILSRRIERAVNVRRKVFEHKKPICEGCGLEPGRDYRILGGKEASLLDVHHTTPIGTLREGEVRRYNIPDDFIVLCPTCHRKIHQLGDPSDLAALRREVRFKHMRELY